MEASAKARVVGSRLDCMECNGDGACKGGWLMEVSQVQPEEKRGKETRGCLGLDENSLCQK